MEIIMKHNFTDIGFCKVHFKTSVEEKDYHYCLMEDGNDVKLYRTTGPDWYEANYPVKIADKKQVRFEEPDDDYGKELLKQFLKK